MRWRRTTAISCFAVIFLPAQEDRAAAHEPVMPAHEVRERLDRIERALRDFREWPIVPPVPSTEEDERKLLGAAELQLALGRHHRALGLLFARFEDPRFQTMPEYVGALLLASQILESIDEAAGAMEYAAKALAHGRARDQVAEATARWFRLSRKNPRGVHRQREMIDLWQARVGETHPGASEIVAEAAYEVAHALRGRGERKEARALLRDIPSSTKIGSRAAFLAGVIYVEENDLARGERWFLAIMDWPTPEILHTQLELETSVRELATLSAARLQFQRGDLEGADRTYRRIPEGSPLEPDACWERAFLDIERLRPRGAEKRLQCALDLGARGSRLIDAKLFRASLLAHLSRYETSVGVYGFLKASLEREAQRFRIASALIEAPTEVLFQAMERNALGQGKDASPGPATLFWDAWTPDVDRAYQIDRGIDHAGAALGVLSREVLAITELLDREDAFRALAGRRRALARLHQDLEHLRSHAAGIQSHAEEHRPDLLPARRVDDPIDGIAVEVGRQLAELDENERRRRALAAKILGELRREIASVLSNADRVERDAKGPVDAASKQAITDIGAFLDDAAMRAEVGILDTFWLKKNHKTRAIENLLQRQKEDERDASAAARELADDVP